jgi:GntR family transcriptional regulator
MRSIYDAVADHLKSAIISGEIASGVKLPTERAFARRYGLARVTVRAALARLQSEGLISRRTRTGTIVLSISPPHEPRQEDRR